MATGDPNQLADGYFGAMSVAVGLGVGGARLGADDFETSGARGRLSPDDLEESGSSWRKAWDAGAGDCLVGANSFAADTPVQTPDGEKPISDIQVGDMVLAYDEATGSTGAYTVTAVISHSDALQVRLTIDGETLETTPEHPFYVLLRGWVAASDLQPGMAVRRADGSYGAVQAVALERQPQTMYNLTVAGAHTFFVGEEGWLVHNAKCDKFERFGSAAEASASRDAGGLVPRPYPHNRQPKWIADPGKVNPRTLGDKNNYTHQMVFETKPGTRQWVRDQGFEIKPDNEPDRYAIPVGWLDEFNARVIRVIIKKIR
nr:polymorphic toxin-type HINT domain-containing protein [Oscillochloris trichoides]